ncbi:MAG: ParB/RepB/Spo0J family partition protein [bacterium]|nr:ParB/RepB/Spo0J family partition protein [bacterium]
MSVEFLNENYELVDVESIHEHPENPRQGDEKEIDASIKSNAFYGACVVQKSTRYVIVGNHRFRRFKAAGGKKVPVFWLDVDDQKAVQIMLADNKTRDNARGSMDNERLLDSLLQLASDKRGLSGTGYVEATLQRLREEAGTPPPPPDEEEVEYKESPTVHVQLGPLRFKVSRKTYDAWIAKKMRQNSFNIKAVARAIRQDLGIESVEKS